VRAGLIALAVVPPETFFSGLIALAVFLALSIAIVAWVHTGDGLHYFRKFTAKFMPITRVQGLKLPSPRDPRWKVMLTEDAADAARRLGTLLPAQYQLGNIIVLANSERLLIKIESVELSVAGRLLDVTRDDVLAYVQAVHTRQVQQSMRLSISAAVEEIERAYARKLP
jgi:hypothetical protein